MSCKHMNLMRKSLPVILNKIILRCYIKRYFTSVANGQTKQNKQYISLLTRVAKRASLIVYSYICFISVHLSFFYMSLRLDLCFCMSIGFNQKYWLWQPDITKKIDFEFLSPWQPFRIHLSMRDIIAIVKLVFFPKNKPLIDEIPGNPLVIMACLKLYF